MADGTDFSGDAGQVVQIGGSVYGDIVFAASPDRTKAAEEFERRYRAGVLASADQVQLIGLEWYRPHRLSESYVEMSVEPTAAGPSFAETTVGELLDRHRLVLLEGAAGGGKTTVLRRLTVRAARGEAIGGRPVVPFLLRLRTLVSDDHLHLPQPDALVTATAAAGGAPPPGWADDLLTAGTALVMVDGLDEVRDAHRRPVLDWLRTLLTWYDKATFVLTARPAALRGTWLRELRGLGFVTAALAPMSPVQVRRFIDGWWAASLPTDTADAATLKALVDSDPALARELTSPLLCAVLCARYATRGTAGLGRIDLYRAALDLYLGRRDISRQIRSAQWQLPVPVSTRILSTIAFWMLIEGQDTIPVQTANTVVAEVAERVLDQGTLSWGQPGAEGLLSALIEQTGLLQPDSDGALAFRFPGVQDYLAATHAMSRGHVGHLVREAHRGRYRDVVVLAAREAGPNRTKLITGLVDRAGAEPAHRRHLWFLAAECVAFDGDELGDAVRSGLVALLPPTDFDEADQVARGGSRVIGALVSLAAGRLTDMEAAAVVRAVSLARWPGAVSVLELFVGRSDPLVHRELLAAWARAVDPAGYARRVLGRMSLGGEWVDLPDVDFVPYLVGVPGVRRLRLPSWADAGAVAAVVAVVGRGVEVRVAGR